MNKIKVLYVDDEEINLLLFEANLKNKFEVITIDNGHTALKQLTYHQNIDVIISDMKMPNMNGVEFIKKAKKLIPHAQYYILTGYGMTDEINKAINTGLINKKFDKPFNIDEIVDEIEKSAQDSDKHTF